MLPPSLPMFCVVGGGVLRRAEGREGWVGGLEGWWWGGLYGWTIIMGQMDEVWG